MGRKIKNGHVAKKGYFVAQEDTNVFNVFAYADFNRNGYYIGHNDMEGYHITDFDIVAEFDGFEAAVAWADDAESKAYYQ